MLANIGHDFRLELDRPGFAGDMRGIDFGDQPVIATVDPSVETMLAHQFDGLTRQIGGHHLLFQDRQIALNEEPAIEPGNRRVELERVKQHGHTTWWPTAGYCETNAGTLQRT